MLSRLMTQILRELDDEDLAAVAALVADEQARRARLRELARTAGKEVRST